jgi:hypothetical protein
MINFAKLNEMANYIPDDTGLPMTIYISDKRSCKHGARIKVSGTYGNKMISDVFSVTISNTPEVVKDQDTFNIKSKDIELVKKFILLNKVNLLRYWNLEIGTGELVRNLKKVIL